MDSGIISFRKNETVYFSRVRRAIRIFDRKLERKKQSREKAKKKEKQVSGEK